MTPHEHNAQSQGSSPAETQQDTGKKEPSNTGSTQQCTPDYMSAATGAIPIVSPGADAIASATIEDESGRRIQLTKADEAEGAPPETPAKTRIPTGLKVLIAASFMIALGYGLVAPVLPSFARSFNVGVAATTIVVSALAAMRLVFAPGAGKLISRFGERPIYTCGMVIVAVSSFVNAAAWDYWVLLASRAFAGIGSVMFTVSAMGLLVRLAPSHMRGRVSGYYATAFLLGNIMGPVVGGALSGLGMRLPFALYGCSLLVAGAIVWFMLPPADQIDAEREAYSLPTQDDVAPSASSDADKPGTASAPAADAPASGRNSVSGQEPSQQKTPTPAIMTVRQALKFTNYRSALFTNFTIGWAVLGIQSSLIPLLAAYLATGGDASKASEGTVLASTVMAVGSLANALTQTVSGRLSDSLGRRIMIFIGLLIAGTAISTIGISSAPWMLITLIVGMGAGAALITPSLQASVADVIGGKRDGAPVLATFQMHSDFGMILGPLLAGAVADTWGFTPAFMLCGGLLLAASLTWLPFRTPRWPRELADENYTGK